MSARNNTFSADSLGAGAFEAEKFGAEKRAAEKRAAEKLDDKSFSMGFGGAGAALGASSSRAPWRTHGAVDELERLHVEELARLLAQAAVSRDEWVCGGGLPGAGRAPQVEREYAAWRCALEDELAAARADGARHSPALRDLLAACTADRVVWPAARELALAAAGLHPSARHRVVLGEIAHRAADRVGARAAYEAALAVGPTARLRAQIEAALRELAADEARRCSRP